MKLMHYLNACRTDIWQGKTKLIRHVDDRWDLELLARTPAHFLEYQSRQSSHVFNCDVIVSFLGEGRTRSRFIGVYEVQEHSTGETSLPAPQGWPYPDMPPGKHRYRLAQLPGFDELRDRLVIDWGPGARSWHQWLKDGSEKPVIELLPRGHVRDFPGYDDVHLTFHELHTIVSHPDANRLWHKMLGVVAGVYLIVDGKSGDLYVGSACGESGIIGRWKDYVGSKHGGNKRLKALLDADPTRYTSFTFSILRTLSRTLTKREVIDVECRYKRKLGSRAFGLNEN